MPAFRYRTCADQRESVSRSALCDSILFNKGAPGRIFNACGETTNICLAQFGIPSPNQPV